MSYAKITLLMVALASIALGGFMFYQIVWIERVAGKAALVVNTTRDGANVFVNNRLLGTTPFYSNSITPGAVTVSIRSEDSTYDIDLQLEAHTETVINRELGPNRDFTAGDIIWLERTNRQPSLSVISSPPGALVRLDGEVVGDTPLSVTDLVPREYDLHVMADGYEGRVLMVHIQDGYKLNATFDLFPKPMGRELKKSDLSVDNVTIYPLHLEDVRVSTSIKEHIQAIQYWLATRPDYLPEEAPEGLNIRYYVTEAGEIYDNVGDPVTPEAVEETEVISIAYYGDGAILTDRALEAVNVLAGNIEVIVRDTDDEDETDVPADIGGTRAMILDTGTGWLRVRSGPGLGFDEVTRVDVGETFEVMEQEPNWVKIRIDTQTEGWVSSAYVSVTGE